MPGSRPAGAARTNVARVLLALAFVIGYLLFNSLVVGALVLGTGASLDRDDAHVFLALTAAELLTLAAVLALVRVSRMSMSTMGWRTRAGDVVATLARTGPFLLVFTALPVLALRLSGDHVLAAHMSLARALAIAAFAFAVGFTEEIAFRGVVVELLGARRAPALALVGSAVLFALPHAPWGASLSQETGAYANALAVGLAVGLPFAAIRLLGGSLAGLAIAHGVLDCVSLLRVGSIHVPRGTEAAAWQQVALAACVSIGYVVWFALRGGFRRVDAPVEPAPVVVD